MEADPTGAATGSSAQLSSVYTKSSKGKNVQQTYKLSEGHIPCSSISLAQGSFDVFFFALRIGMQHVAFVTHRLHHSRSFAMHTQPCAVSILRVDGKTEL